MKDLINELNPTNPYLKKKVKDNDGEISEEEEMLYDLLEMGFCDGDFTMDTDKYECVIECAKLIINTKGEDKAVLALADAFGYYATTTELGAHSLTKDHDAVEQLYVANEGFGEALEKMWEAIKSFFTKIWNFITGNGWTDTAGPESFDKSKKTTSETKKKAEHMKNELTAGQKNKKVNFTDYDDKQFQVIIDMTYEILRNHKDYIRSILKPKTFEEMLKAHDKEKTKELKNDIDNMVKERAKLTKKVQEGIKVDDLLIQFNRTLKSHEVWLNYTREFAPLIQDIEKTRINLDSFKPKDGDKELSSKYAKVQSDYTTCVSALKNCIIDTKKMIDAYNKRCRYIMQSKMTLEEIMDSDEPLTTSPLR